MTTSRRILIVLLGLGLLSGLVLVAVGLFAPGSEVPPARPTIAIPLTPPVQIDPKLASVLLQLQDILRREGPEAARAFAIRNSLMSSDNVIHVTLDLDTDDPAAQDEVARQLQVWGVQIETRRRGALDVAVTLDQLAKTLAIPTVGPGTPPALPLTPGLPALPTTVLQGMAHLQHVRRVHLPQQPQPFVQGQSPVRLSGGSEGVHLVHADTWQQAGFSGRGIKVGILDVGGFQGYRAQLGTTLPASVQARAFNRSKNIEGNPDDALDARVHGTACAEIVHEMAPAAQLYLAAFDTDEESAINWLADQGVQIISASFGSHYLQPDGNNAEDRLVDAARRRGILWVNAAGNEGEDHYQGTFRQGPDNLSVFDNGTTLLGLQVGSTGPTSVLLRWDDWQTRKIDYDLYLFDAHGKMIASSTDLQDGPGTQPVEEIRYVLDADTQYYLAIGAAKGAQAVRYDIFVHGGQVQLESSTARESLGSPADARGAFAVGAVDWDTDGRASYSSEGPTADGRLKPDISAPAGVRSASYPRFDGTSAAAPHVAGAAALVWSAQPGSNADAVERFLVTRALDLGTPGPDIEYGAGRLDLGSPPQGGAPLPPTLAAVVPSVAPARTPAPTRTPAPAPRAPSAHSNSWMVPFGAGIVVATLIMGSGVWLRNRRRLPPAPARNLRPAVYAPPPNPPRPPAPPAGPPPAPRLPAPPGTYLASAPPRPPPLPPHPGTAASGGPAAAPLGRVFCPNCRALLDPHTGQCAHCGWHSP